MSRIGKLPISVPGGVTITVDDGNTVTVKGPKGTLSEKISPDMEIEGVGYRAQLQGSKLVLNMGYSHPVEFDAPEGITFEVPAPNRIVVKGASKQQVGQMAADIRAVREPEPYKGKGIRYAGEYVRRKEGKTGK